MRTSRGGSGPPATLYYWPPSAGIPAIETSGVSWEYGDKTLLQETLPHGSEP